jgi:hypothetical protein
LSWANFSGILSGSDIGFTNVVWHSRQREVIMRLNRTLSGKPGLFDHECAALKYVIGN